MYPRLNLIGTHVGLPHGAEAIAHSAPVAHYARRLGALLHQIRRVGAQAVHTDPVIRKASQEYDGWENAAITTAAEYSSDLSQVERNAILKKFKKGEIRLYVLRHL
ncbi:hypothetical protein BC936DRAFT_141635 [Jimgerdemannia flammicorona]|uniref:Uncharacterized protein n=1 Tax=Jimgerdemannia flammicorona TaxID=994334 RepID=A0A433A1W6_9FUNG|nr:hypothetical protein BC936DRAFT_141635 [Jimgerdemannia flammicorona]